MENNYINWFEIPVTDMDRASTFYSEVFGFKIEPDDVSGPEFKMGIFSHIAGGGVAGALIKGPGYEPGDKGPLLYLNAGNDLLEALKKVEPAGGKVVMPKTKISDNHGHFAIFLDTEGNKLAMHSMS